MQKAVSDTHLRAHETVLDRGCRLLLEKKKNAGERKKVHEPMYEQKKTKEKTS